MKKVLFVINTMGRAGAERALLGLLRKLEDQPYEISLYVLLGQGELMDELPPAIRLLNSKYSTELAQIDKYSLFPDYIKDQCENFSSQKVIFAQGIIDHIAVEDMEVLDLKERISELITAIKKWNHLD